MGASASFGCVGAKEDANDKSYPALIDAHRVLGSAERNDDRSQTAAPREPAHIHGASWHSGAAVEPDRRGFGAA